MYRQTFLSDKPLQNIHIVTGFLEEHRRASFGISPISAHEAVALVDVADGLCKLYIYDISDLSAVDQLSHGSEKRRVPQNVADEDGNALLLCRLADNEGC